MGRPRIHTERDIPDHGERRKLLGERGKHADPRMAEDVNPGDARWCEQHGKLECTARKNSSSRPGFEGDPNCHRGAIRGVNKCSLHGGRGNNSRVLMLRGEAQITAWSAMGRPSPGTHVEPSEVVLNMLQMSWLRASAYGDMLRRQVEKEAAEATDEAGGVGGLIGHRMAATAVGEIYAASEDVRALVKLESEERDRAVEYAMKAHKMGISDRLTKMAEQWGDVVAGRISVMLDELGLNARQQALVPLLITRHLSSIDMLSAPIEGQIVE